jgi:thymidylate synthase
MLNPQFIQARDLGDAWFQCLYRILDEGYMFTIDRGSYAGQKRLEFDFATIHIKFPGTRPLLPQIEAHHSIPNPVADDYLDDYVSYLMTGELKKGESYTYGQRMNQSKILSENSPIWMKDRDEWKNILLQDNEVFNDKKIIIRELSKTGAISGWFLNQVELLIWTYKNKGYRNNQMILQVAEPTDMLLQDPPCLRHIDTRIQDGKLHFYPYFRSWDLWGGFPANLGGIQLMKEYVASEIGVEDGEIIATSKGLHLYDHCFELAKCLRMNENITLKEGK